MSPGVCHPGVGCTVERKDVITSYPPSLLYPTPPPPLLLRFRLLYSKRLNYSLTKTCETTLPEFRFDTSSTFISPSHSSTFILKKEKEGPVTGEGVPGVSSLTLSKHVCYLFILLNFILLKILLNVKVIRIFGICFLVLWSST